MPFQYWNRYTNFLINGEQTVVPFVPVPAKTSDKNYIFIIGQSRLDKASQQFYGSPYFGWLIMAANPQYSGNEYSIPDGAVLTIPYPLVASLQDYKNALENYFFYYGR